MPIKLSEIDLKVKMSNALNAMRNAYPTLREQRVFHTYLSRINPKDIKTARVRFTLDEFKELCDIKEDHVKAFKEIADKLLQGIITLDERDENGKKTGSFSKINLFNRCDFAQDKVTDKWYFDVFPNEFGRKYFFELNNPYFSYQLKIMLRFTSVYQIRLYDILRQYLSHLAIRPSPLRREMNCHPC